jgi:hypothetical protein
LIKSPGQTFYQSISKNIFFFLIFFKCVEQAQKYLPELLKNIFKILKNSNFFALFSTSGDERFAKHSSPDNSSPEDSSPEDSLLEIFFPGGGRFFAGVFFARLILRRKFFEILR